MYYHLLPFFMQIKKPIGDALEDFESLLPAQYKVAFGIKKERVQASIWNIIVDQKEIIILLTPTLEIHQVPMP
uniref:Uncharacterized protein n=1 Tax=Rhizophora mucronata TaxID=61149 RepID=A0A2P2PQB1_RHIMU